MNILFITHHKKPRVGGVEKHVEEVSSKLIEIGYDVKVVSGEDIKFPKVKIIGLLYIWFWFLKNIKIIKKTNIVHIHDVFIWYLPFVFLFPVKKVYVTFHGWEGKCPIPVWNILNKRVAAFLSNGNICVGKYIEKYYGIKANKVIYGGTEKRVKQKMKKKVKNTIIYLGRLDKDTGVLDFLTYLKNSKNKYKVTFLGDGPLKKECKKYGNVLGFVKKPDKYLETSEYCVPGGYLSYLEAKSFECKILTFANNDLKKDYWNEIKKIKKIPTWVDVTNEYISLYNNF